MKTNLSCKSVFQALSLGAALGFAGALIYGFLFTIYGILRVSLWIINAPANDLLPTLLTNAISVLIGSVFFAVLFGLLAAVIQAATLALVYGISRRWNAAGDPRSGAIIGLLAAGTLCLGLLLLFRSGPEILLQVFWRQSFFFWFGLPGALYVAVNGWLGSRLRFGAAVPSQPAERQDALIALAR